MSTNYLRLDMLQWKVDMKWIKQEQQKLVRIKLKWKDGGRTVATECGVEPVPQFRGGKSRTVEKS